MNATEKSPVGARLASPAQSHVRMVVGFAFGPDREEVILIKREKEDWYKGYANGPGGHVEPRERPEDAIAREFEEEAGIRVPRDCWRELVVMTVRDEKIVHFFAADLDGDLLNQARTASDEGEIFRAAVEHIHEQLLVPPAHWIIPLALDPDVSLPLMIASN